MSDAKPPLRREHPLEQIHPKPRTTVRRFAADMKARIERAAVAFEQPGQDERVAGMRYVLGIVDAALSDYDVRDPGEPIASPPRHESEEKSPPDTTAIRAFASGMRTSVGIRDELLAAQSHLLALCDALDAGREANATKAPPRRASEEKVEPLTEVEIAKIREVSARYSGQYQFELRVLATLDAERAANAEMRRALEPCGIDEDNPDTCGMCRKHFSDCEQERATDGETEYPACAGSRARAALRAAEKAPETTEPAPPAGDGLTAEEWADVEKVLAMQANMNGVASIHVESMARRLLPRVRAAAEKAGGR